MSSMDSSVVMIFLVLPLSTHDYCNRGWNRSAIHVSTLENPEPGFPLLMLKLNASYRMMTSATLSSTNVDSSRPEPTLSWGHDVLMWGRGTLVLAPNNHLSIFTTFCSTPTCCKNCKYLWLFIHYLFIITPYPCYPSFYSLALTKNGSCESISNMSLLRHTTFYIMIHILMALLHVTIYYIHHHILDLR